MLPAPLGKPFRVCQKRELKNWDQGSEELISANPRTIGLLDKKKSPLPHKAPQLLPAESQQGAKTDLLSAI